MCDAGFLNRHVGDLCSCALSAKRILSRKLYPHNLTVLEEITKMNGHPKMDDRSSVSYGVRFYLWR